MFLGGCPGQNTTPTGHCPRRTRLEGRTRLDGEPNSLRIPTDVWEEIATDPREVWKTCLGLELVCTLRIRVRVVRERDCFLYTRRVADGTFAR